MDLIKKIRGIVGTIFSVGTINVKDNSGVAEVKNSGDTDFAVLRAKSIQTSNDLNDVVTLIDAMDKIIQFSFDGASAPAAGTNTNKFGFCHTTGGSYTVNDVVFDDGDALIKLPRDVVKLFATTSAVSGTVSLNANGIYGWNGTAYELKGDGGATDTGKVKAIEIAFDFEDTTVDSTTAIPAGARIIKRTVKVASGAAFNGTTPTLEAKVNGSTPLTIVPTTLVNLKLADTQHEDTAVQEVSEDNAGVVRATVTPSTSDAGSGLLIIEYSVPNV